MKGNFAKKLTSVFLAGLLLAVTVAGCGEGKSANAKTSSYEEMVSYLTEQGFISKDAQAVDINTTEGYVTDNTGGEMPVAEIADRACDYDGLWLFWWDLDNGTQYQDVYDGLTYNQDMLVIAGGAAILQASGHNGAYAIAFSEDYGKADEALKAFLALPAE